MEIPFWKYHALGNDYIVIDPHTLSQPLQLQKHLIERICHRHFGVGSDGILWGPVMKNGEIHLRIFNPDGSEAEKSGNGIRIFSRYLADADYVKTPQFALHTLGGKVVVEFLQDGMIKVDMGVATVENRTLTVKGQPLAVSSVSIGNPHCVVVLDAISAKLARELGPLIEVHPLFPNKTNVQFLKILNRSTIQIEIWERGAGYTLASGSSSCAATSAAYTLGLVDPIVTVKMPGGDIGIEIKTDGHVYMTGPVTRVAHGIIHKECL